ncbi:hydrogenase subunit MbhD domain-containing protein [Ancylomarina longa]|nr:hydrogenase subunit MbhD domain-containing protein [Ancylomarina longa]
MRNFIINRIKRGVVFGVIFIGVSIYFYFTNALDLALTFFVISITLIVVYLIYFFSKKGSI